jgi:aspartate carbamoyltransferase catalytic subunit
MKHLLRIKDLNKDELATLVDLATEYRAQGNIKNPKPHTIDKKAVCFFAVPSSRTKSS